MAVNILKKTKGKQPYCDKGTFLASKRKKCRQRRETEKKEKESSKNGRHEKKAYHPENGKRGEHSS